MGRSRMIVQAVRTDQLGRTESPSDGLLTSCFDGFEAMKDSSPGSAVVVLIEDGEYKVCLMIEESP